MMYEAVGVFGMKYAIMGKVSPLSFSLILITGKNNNTIKKINLNPQRCRKKCEKATAKRFRAS